MARPAIRGGAALVVVAIDMPPVAGAGRPSCVHPVITSTAATGSAP